MDLIHRNTPSLTLVSTILAVLVFTLCLASNTMAEEAPIEVELPPDDPPGPGDLPDKEAPPKQAPPDETEPTEPPAVESPDETAPSEDTPTGAPDMSPESPPSSGDPAPPANASPPRSTEETPSSAPQRDDQFQGVVLPPSTSTPAPAPAPTPSPAPSENPAPSASTSPAPPPATTPSTGTPPSENITTATQAVNTPPKQTPRKEGPPKEKEADIFAKVSVSPQVGYLFFPKSDMSFQGMQATVDPRNGLVFKLHLDLGGDGLAFEIAPFYAMEWGGIHADASGFGNLTSIDFGKSAGGASFQAAGGEISIVYRFSIRRFFPHLGAGFRGAYLFGDQIKYGTEIYGRFPIGFTAYLGKHAAFLFEVGLMAGATGVRTNPQLPEAFDTMDPAIREQLEGADSQADFQAWYDDNEGYLQGWMLENQDALPDGYSTDQMRADFVAEQMSKTIRFGSGFGMDIMIGLRFP